MAVLYFGASSAGANNGSSWNDRMAFVVSGAINTAISAFDFTADFLIARIGPGTYSLTTSIASFTGASGPSLLFPCILEAANSDGTRWTPPDPNWISPMPAWDSSTMPEIVTTTNIATVNNINVSLYGLKITASGRNGSVTNNARRIDWCFVTNTTSNTSVTCGVINGSNCVYACTGTGYANVGATPVPGSLFNIRIEGNSSATTGTRLGLVNVSNTGFGIENCTIVNNPGGGVHQTGTATNASIYCNRLTMYGNGGDNIFAASTRTTSPSTVVGCFIVGGNNSVRIDTTAHPSIARNNRFRNFSSAALSNVTSAYTANNNGNTDAAGTDADEFVNVASGDYRIKNTSLYWGKGYGAGDEPAAGGGASGLWLGHLGQTGIGAF
jgi:hypothetical protein